MTRIKIVLSTAMALGFVSAAGALPRETVDFGGVPSPIGVVEVTQKHFAPAWRPYAAELPYAAQEEAAFRRASRFPN